MQTYAQDANKIIQFLTKNFECFWFFINSNKLIIWDFSSIQDFSRWFQNMEIEYSNTSISRALIIQKSTDFLHILHHDQLYKKTGFEASFWWSDLDNTLEVSVRFFTILYPTSNINFWQSFSFNTYGED